MNRATLITEGKIWALRGGGALLLLILINELSKRLKEQKAIRAAATTVDEPLDETQKNSIIQIVRAFRKDGDKDVRKLAYILATARHESRFKPIREYRAKASQTTLYNLQNRYWYTGYYGRGFVQLTWESNYREMGELLKIDLVNKPDLALDPYFGARILVSGMINGNFGHRLDRYINNTQKDYWNARRSVNGTDKADLIANYALQIEKNL